MGTAPPPGSLPSAPDAERLLAQMLQALAARGYSETDSLALIMECTARAQLMMWRAGLRELEWYSEIIALAGARVRVLSPMGQQSGVQRDGDTHNNTPEGRAGQAT